MARGLPPAGSEEAKRRYAQYRHAVIGMWVSVPLGIAALIVFWSPVAMVLLILIAVSLPIGIRGQLKTLRLMRSNASGPQR